MSNLEIGNGCTLRLGLTARNRFAHALVLLKRAHSLVMLRVADVGRENALEIATEHIENGA